MGKEYEGRLTLASKGLLYGDKLPGGELNCRCWGTLEERTLVTPNLNFADILDRLITRLTDCPIPPGDLLLIDRQHIFFYMRCLSYGGDFSFPYQCSECSQKVVHTMDLEKDLEVKYADDPLFLKSIGLNSPMEFSEPFTFELPVQHKKVGWRMLRGSDERAVDKYVKQMTKRRKSEEERPDYIYRLALRVMEIDGKEADIGEAMTLIESLRGRDALEIRQQIEAVDIGIETEIPCTCNQCGYENEIILPMDKSFFLPGRKTA